MYTDRLEHYKKLEKARNSKLIVYITSDRPNLGTQIASDILSPFTEHLDKIGDVRRISLYMYTRGGNTLANILIGLSKHIHPLTLGQVYKSKSQIQMLADKLLSFHDNKDAKKKDVIKFLCSESGSHDYTIHRKEAINLGLNIEKPSMDLYQVIKNIYDDIETELEFRTPFNPNIVLGSSNQVNYQLR